MHHIGNRYIQIYHPVSALVRNTWTTSPWCIGVGVHALNGQRIQKQNAQTKIEVKKRVQNISPEWELVEIANASTLLTLQRLI